jgi:hypothetical protein
LRECDGFERPNIAKQLQDLGPAAIEPLLFAISDENWVIRHWAARVLGRLYATRALSALVAQLTVEPDRIVRDTIAEALIIIRTGPTPANDGHSQPAAESATRSTQIAGTTPFRASTSKETPPETRVTQREISSLRAALRDAFEKSDQTRIQDVRPRLIERQLALCALLKGRALLPPENAELRAFYSAAAEREVFFREYRNVCWVCKARIDDKNNPSCGCTWHVCKCDACQCPDYSLGPKRKRFHPEPEPECPEQIARLGRAHYDSLVAERRARWDWSAWSEDDRTPACGNMGEFHELSYADQPPPEGYMWEEQVDDLKKR